MIQALIECGILRSVEFYVMMVVVAAAVVGICVRPSRRGEAETIFSPGLLWFDEVAGEPRIEVEVRSDGTVAIIRRGIGLLGGESKVSLAITRIGFDLAIEERVADVPGGEPVNAAMFVLDFLGAERYHISYSAAHANLFTSLTLAVKPGLHVSRDLKR